MVSSGFPSYPSRNGSFRSFQRYTRTAFTPATKAWLKKVSRSCAFSLCVTGAVIPLTYAQSSPVLEVGKFSVAVPGTELPAGWKPLTFKKVERQTRYDLVIDEGTVVMKAVSDAAGSGLTKEIAINPKEYPIVQWRWKVANVLNKSDVTKKAGDDYSARLYIAFAYDPSKAGLFEKVKYETARLIYGRYPPIGAINYIWATREPGGTVAPNPYTDRAMMIVVESGTGALNRWIVEERNAYTDYKQAFKEEPPMISGVAIMTDTDNTGEAATAYYGDITFKKERTL
ncbi:MAG: DUF3047 domain-containing protein [Nitrospiraceae bacterium]|nr:DUF3047 domain-containing protein [Nitrospiraceae bacterium]